MAPNSRASHFPRLSSRHRDSASTNATTEVHFRVSIKTALEETVKLVGDCTELGEWDISRGIELSTKPEAYPTWTTIKPVVLPLRQSIDYKYVIVTLAGDFVRWEPFEGNRVVVPNGISMCVEDDNGAGRQFPAILTPPESSSRSELLSLTRIPDKRSSFTSSDVQDGCRSIVPTSRRDLNETIRELQNADFIPPINENDTLIICSFELPLKVTRKDDGNFQVEKQKSLVMPSLHALRHLVRVPVKFVGWPGIVAENEQDKRQIEELLEPCDCIPVFLTSDQLELFCNFCHRCLWPLFHNVVVLDNYTKEPFNETEWQSYQSVNRLYADEVVNHAHETDLIWIHDYYLLLSPQYITRRIRKANVGLFLHIPFPSSEIFRCLPVREEILRGMLCADLIGFHFFEYARHFLVVNKRLLGLDHHFRMGGFLELDYGGKNVLLKIGHVHVQYDHLRRRIDESSIIYQQTLAFKSRFEGRFLFASVDRCERLAGILLKLRGFQHFLRNYPYARSRAVLIQFAYPTVHVWEDLNEHVTEILSLAAEINDEFAKSLNVDASHLSDQCVVIEVRSITAEEKYALFQAADCLLDTSVRDGLNLNPFEYICCRKDDPAPLILSEFTGCCRALAAAMRVNPWKSDNISQTMDRAMNTPAEDLRDRFLRDQMYLQRNSTLQWAEEFLLDLRRARKREDLVYVSWGFGTSYRVVGLDSHFQYLDSDVVVQSFRKAKRKILFFDHEGTLAPDRRRITAVPGHESLTATGSAPSAQILKCLASLCAAGNVVVILSGRDRKLLEEWFGGTPGIGLCAEHGFYYKVPQITGERWQSASSKVEDFTWKEIAMELMKQYVKRTQGAFIENKGSALVFQYRDADPDFGSWQAKELANYLEELLFGCPVTIMSGKGYVEAKLSGVNKGLAVQHILDKIVVLYEKRTEAPLDFILCIGDDRSDEDMFPVVNQFFECLKGLTTPLPATDVEACGAVTPVHASRHREIEKLNKNSSDHENFAAEGSKNQVLLKEKADEKNLQSIRKSSFNSGMLLGRTSLGRRSSPSLPACFSVTVGKKPSHARYYVNDIEEVSELLSALRQHSNSGEVTALSTWKPSI